MGKRNQTNFSIFIVLVWILHIVKGDESCGFIKHEKPAIQDRYVRFELTPASSYHANMSVKWFISYHLNKHGYVRIDKSIFDFNTSESNGTFKLDVKATKGVVIKLFAEIGCRTPIKYSVNLILQDIKKCGTLYLQPKHFKPGTDVKIRYFPDVSESGSFYHTWRVINSTCEGPLGCVISEERGTFEMNKNTFYNDTEFYLEIMSMNTDRDGTYLVQCDENRLTDGVAIHTPVRPSQPVILNQHAIDKECSGCIAGDLNGYTKIVCETHGGTNPKVKIFVNNVDYAVSNNNPRYTIVVHTSRHKHGKRIRCEVNNAALESPLFAETTLYLIVQPARPIITMGVIKEGQPVNVSCSSEGGRPIPSLKLNIINIKEAALHVTSSVIKKAGKKLSIIRLHNMERSWNSQNLRCCTVNVFQKEQCSSRTIQYLFTPEAVSIEKKWDVDKIQDVYSFDVTCTLWQYSALCRPEWRIDESMIPSFPVATKMDRSKKSSTHSEHINVTRSDNGKRLTCLAKCEGFSSNKSDAFIILVPYEPILTLDVPPQVNVSEGESLVATCTADSFPLALVTWYNESMVESLYSQACGLQSACLRLEPVARSHSGNYTCVAKNKLSKQVQQSLTITVHRSSITRTAQQDDNSSGSAKFMITVLVLAVVVVVAVVVVIVIVVMKRKRRAAVPKSTAGPTNDDEEGNADQADVHRYETLNATREPQVYEEIQPNRDSDQRKASDDHHYEALNASREPQAYEALQPSTYSDQPLTSDEYGYEALNTTRETQVYADLQQDTGNDQRQNARVSTDDSVQVDYYNMNSYLREETAEEMPDDAYELPNT